MDVRTDAGIQNALRAELSGAEGGGRSLITIAHRLRTVADYDKVVVMGVGKVLEAGTTSHLMAKKGEFYEMVRQSGNREAFVALL